MSTLLKRLSRFEIRADAEIERFLFHHHFLGFLMIFIWHPDDYPDCSLSVYRCHYSPHRILFST